LPEKEKAEPAAPKPKASSAAPKAEKPAAKPEKPAPKAEKPAPKPEAPREAKQDEEAPVARYAPSPPVAPKPAEEAPRAEKPAAPAPAKEKAPARRRDVEGLRKGLAKAREKEGFFGRLKALFVGRKEIDPQIVEEIEEVLLTSDVGVKTTAMLLDDIKDKLEKKELADTDKVWDALRAHASSILSIGSGGIALSARPTVVMMVGVNGV